MAGKIYLYGIIGMDWWEEVDNSAKRFLKDFSALEKTEDEIHIHINSVGGDVHEGLAIFNTIKNSETKTVVFIDGIAYSMGAMISLAADECRIAKNGLFMLHNVSGGARGNAKDLRKTAQIMDTYDTSLATSIADKTNQTIEEVKSLWMDFEDHFLTAQEAYDFKLVDEILHTEVDLDAIYKQDDYQSIMKAYTSKPINKPGDKKTNNQDKNLVQQIVEAITGKNQKPKNDSDMLIKAGMNALFLALAIEATDKDVDITEDQLTQLNTVVADLQAKQAKFDSDKQALEDEKTQLENTVAERDQTIKDLGEKDGAEPTKPTGGVDPVAGNKKEDNFYSTADEELKLLKNKM